MKMPAFSALNPIYFLQTFVLELLHACEQHGGAKGEYIEHIAHSAGHFFEETYRNDFSLQGELDVERYADLILSLKNHIGGNFSLDSSDSKSVRVVNTRCPFGEGVKNFPELCRMTSSVFGGIAARNFGYAKVHISECIAQGNSHCRVCIHLDREHAQEQPGREYLAPEVAKKEREDIDALQSQIDEQLHKLWLQTGGKRGRRDKVIARPTIVADSVPMQKVLKAIQKIAPTDVTVLIQGDTGVGKELVAHAIHAMSHRADRPFIAVNCGAIPETLIESTLFGHEKGAFTGAIDVHQGVFERAEGGTLFLDEVDSLSQQAQVRLLRALQEGEIERVGGKRVIAVNVRIIAATHQDLAKLVEAGLFREDLYYRIHVIQLTIPPLHQRQEDLPALVQLILQRLNKKYGRNINGVSREVMQQIRQYSWPGNVRELENALERSFLFAEGAELTQLELEVKAEDSAVQDWPLLKRRALEKAEKSFLVEALKRYRGNVPEIAAAMGLTTRAVYLKLKRYQLTAATYRVEG